MMEYEVKIEGWWWRGYSVVTYANGREAARIGTFPTKAAARETARLQADAYGCECP